MRDRPLGQGENWPNWDDRWLYQKNILPVSVNGMLMNDGTFENNWTQGISSLFDNMSAIVDATILAGLNGLFTFYDSGNSIDANNIVTNTSVNTIAIANLTLTVPAGHAYKVIYGDMTNPNRGPQPQITYTPNGGTASVTLFPVGTVAEAYSFFGGSGIGTAASDGSMNGPLWMQVADTLDMTDNVFVAGDLVRKQWIYEDYAL